MARQGKEDRRRKQVPHAGRDSTPHLYEALPNRQPLVPEERAGRSGDNEGGPFRYVDVPLAFEGQALPRGQGVSVKEIDVERAACSAVRGARHGSDRSVGRRDRPRADCRFYRRRTDRALVLRRSRPLRDRPVSEREMGRQK